MNKLQRNGVLLLLIEELRKRGSWCGETHVQKSAYFLQELMEVPLGLRFVLYKHGPYSFDLGDTLAQMRADGVISITPRPPFGPSLGAGGNADLTKKLAAKTVADYSEHVQFLAAQLGNKNVASLERVSTAMYVALDGGLAQSREEQANRIVELKPHIQIEEARQAVAEFERMRGLVHGVTG